MRAIVAGGASKRCFAISLHRLAGTAATRVVPIFLACEASRRSAVSARPAPATSMSVLEAHSLNDSSLSAAKSTDNEFRLRPSTAVRQKRFRETPIGAFANNPSACK
jgi:hypothetical protein